MTENEYANRHIPSFIALPSLDEEMASSSTIMQLVRNGKELTTERLLRGGGESSISLCNPMWILDTPESIGLDLVKPSPSNHRKKESNEEVFVTVRDIAEIIGQYYPVNVIDVQHQEELKGWTMGDLVEYFEDENRIRINAHFALQKQQRLGQQQSSRRQRRAAKKCVLKLHNNAPKVLNQISLEFSRTSLATKVRAPRFVRELDWIDHAWPRHLREENNYPSVQYYCLTSTEGCYTDFHVDFGGTSVWYHVLSGAKTFCLIAPTQENLKVYEEWLCLPNQSSVFLPDRIPNHNENVIKLTLQQGQTLIIPTGWIHAVHTPVDSLVFGGNFLHGMDMALQLNIHCIETRTHVPERFRFPHFIALQFYAAGMYYSKLQQDQFLSQAEIDQLPSLIQALEHWWHMKCAKEAAQYVATESGFATVEEFLKALREAWTKACKDESRHTFPIVIDDLVQPDIIAVSNKTSKIRIKVNPRGVPTVNSSTKKDDVKKEKRLRITLSATSKFLHKAPPAEVLPQSKKKQREDVNYIDRADGDDDEWEPSAATSLSIRQQSGIKRKKRSVSKEATATTRKKSDSRKTSQKEEKPKAGNKKAKEKLSAKQRLMRRI